MSTSFIKYYPQYIRNIISDSPHIFLIKNENNAEEISNAWIQKITDEITEKINILKERENILKSSEEKTIL